MRVRIYMMVIVSILLLSTVGSVVNGEGYGDAKIIVTSLNQTQFEQGKDYEFEITFKNSGRAPAYDIDCLLEINETTPVKILNSTPMINIDLLNPEESHVITYSISIDDSAELGVHQVVLQGEYYDGNTEGMVSFEELINLDIVENSDADVFEVELVTTEYLMPGEVIVSTISIKDKDYYTAKNVEVTLDGFDEEAIVLYSSNEASFEKISIGKEETMEVSLYTNENAKAGIYKCDVKIDFEHQGEEKSEIHQLLYIVEVVEEETEEEIIISSVKTSHNSVIPYEQFKVSVSLENEGLETSENIKVSISQDKEVIP